MRVLCGWKIKYDRRGVYLIETDSIHNLYRDFKIKISGEDQKWNKLAEAARNRDPEATDEKIAYEIGWLKPDNARIIWFLPENPAKFFEDTL